MKNLKQDIEKPRKLALYCHMESDNWYMVRDVRYLTHDEHYRPLPEGQTREDVYEGFARVSEPIDIQFTAINSDEIVAKAVEALNAEEMKILNDLNAKLAKIRDRKHQLLALTHQTAECDHEWEYAEYDPSVGLTGSGKACAKCGKTAEDDRGEPDDL